MKYKIIWYYVKEHRPFYYSDARFTCISDAKRLIKRLMQIDKLNNSPCTYSIMEVE